jgi:hypothetical protein
MTEELLAVDLADVNAVAAAAAKYPDKFTYNEERNAIQILNCSGSVSLSVEATEEQATVFHGLR